MDKLKEKSECCGVGNKHPNSGEMYCDLCIKHQNPAPEPQENIDQPEEGWEIEFDKRFCNTVGIDDIIACRWLKTPKNSTQNAIFTKEVKSFIRTALYQERAKLAGEIKEIDFYGWNEDTQRIIKEKLLSAIQGNLKGREDKDGK